MAYAAMKCASLLRETLWSMVSEKHVRDRLRLRGVHLEKNLERYRTAFTGLDL